MQPASAPFPPRPCRCGDPTVLYYDLKLNQIVDAMTFTNLPYFGPPAEGSLSSVKEVNDATYIAQLNGKNLQQSMSRPSQRQNSPTLTQNLNVEVSPSGSSLASPPKKKPSSRFDAAR